MNASRPLRKLPRTAIRSTINLRDRLFRAQSLNQAGRTPFEVIYRDDILQLRYYPAAPQGRGSASTPRPAEKRTPLLIVPPLAVNMLIYDLFEQRSLVRDLRDHGFALYLLDWGRPGRRHDQWHLDDYIRRLLPAAVAQVRAHSKQDDLSLHGWSLGAVMASSYAALDPQIRNLVLLGPPCDYHAQGGVNWQNRLFSRQMRRLQALTGFRPHATRKRWWRAPGWANSMAFKLASPAGTIRGYAELLGRLHDRDYVSGHATHGAFLDDMVAYPGGVMQDIAQYLLTDNILARGELPLRECDARLQQVQANLLILAGTQDPIVPVASSRRLLDLVGSVDKQLIEVPGGHMSIVSGSRAPQAVWPVMRQWLEARSD